MVGAVRDGAEPLDPATARAAAAADYLTFTSASTVRFFLAAAGALDGPRLASIGPATSAAARGRRRARPRGRTPHARGARRRSWPTPRTEPPSSPPRSRPRPGSGRRRPRGPLAMIREGAAGHLPLGLRDDGRVRRRRARGDRADRARGARDRPRPRDPAPRRPAGRADARARAAVRAGRRAPRGRRPRGRRAAPRAIALRTADEDRLLVGPDNGLLLPAAERFGGIAEVVEVSASPWRLEPVSATFHGRDVFAPVAARLARRRAAGRGRRAARPRSSSSRSSCPRPRRDGGRRPATVVGVDGFGNVVAARRPRRPRAPGCGSAVPERRSPPATPSLEATNARTFADVAPGAAIVYEDAAGARRRDQHRRRRGAIARRPARRRGPARGAARRRVRRMTRLGRPRLHLRETASTNDRARALAAAGAPHGTLVTTGAQTAGRGRQGRTWAAPARQGAAVLARSLRDVRPAAAAPRRPGRRRPRGRRGAGQVAERRPGRRPQARRDPRRGTSAGGLGGARHRRQRGDRPRRAPVRAARPRRDARPRPEASRRRSPSSSTTSSTARRAAGRRARRPARSRDALRDRPVRWAGGTGTGAGIDDTGALLVRLPDGRVQTLDAGEVHLGGG